MIDAEFSEFTVLDSEGNPVDNSGLELRNAPESTVNVGLDYYLPVGFAELSLHYNYRWRDEYHMILNNDERSLVESAGFHNASFDMEFSENSTISVYGRNLGDERYARVIPIGISPFGQCSPPKRYGVELNVSC